MGERESAVERFLRMPIPYHAYAAWVRDGSAKWADALQAYEDAKAAALAEWEASRV